jgi:hypothetical protein
MASLLFDLAVLTVELLWWLCGEVIPAACYFTGVLLVSAATFGRVLVQFPRKPETPYRSWRKSTDGKTILSPKLGTVIGFSFWVIVVSATIITFQLT